MAAECHLYSLVLSHMAWCCSPHSYCSLLCFLFNCYVRFPFYYYSFALKGGVGWGIVFFYYTICVIPDEISHFSSSCSVYPTHWYPMMLTVSLLDKYIYIMVELAYYIPWWFSWFPWLSVCTVVIFTSNVWHLFSYPFKKICGCINACDGIKFMVARASSILPVISAFKSAIFILFISSLYAFHQFSYGKFKLLYSHVPLMYCKCDVLGHLYLVIMVRFWLLVPFLRLWCFSPHSRSCVVFPCLLFLVVFLLFFSSSNCVMYSFVSVSPLHFFWTVDGVLCTLADVSVHVRPIQTSVAILLVPDFNLRFTCVWLVTAFDGILLTQMAMPLASHIIVKWSWPAFSETKTETETKPTQRSQITDQNLRKVAHA